MSRIKESKEETPEGNLSHSVDRVEGVLLPATASRMRPVLKGIAAVTAFAFTITTLLPAGWAQPQLKSNTLRVLQPDQAEKKAGLEEALRLKANELVTTRFNDSSQNTKSNVEVNVSIAEHSTIWSERGINRFPVTAVPVVGTVAPAEAVAQTGLEEAPVQSPESHPMKLTRRDFLKTTVGASALAGTLVLQNQFQQPQRTTPVDREVWSPVVLHPTQPFSHRRNEIYLNAQDGRIVVPEPVLREVRPMYVPPAAQAAWEEVTDLYRRMEEGIGLRQKTSTTREEFIEAATTLASEAFATAKPGAFGPVREDVTHGYVEWAPWLIPDEEWASLFVKMRLKAGFPADRAPRAGHSRLFLGAYGLLASTHQDKKEQWMTRVYGPKNAQGERDRPDLGALAHGVDVIPLLGDKLMALAPSIALFMIRELWKEGILRIPSSSDGKTRIALDIEPYELDNYPVTPEDYQNPKKLEFEAQCWRNILWIAEKVQKELNLELKRQSSLTSKYAQVTVFVPTHFADIMTRHRLKIPAGVELVFTDYSNDEEEALANVEPIQALAAGQDGPLAGVTWAVAAEFGRPEREEQKLESFYGQEAKAGSVGQALYNKLQATPGFNRMFVQHFKDNWELRENLTYGASGTPEEERARAQRRANYELLQHMLVAGKGTAQVTKYLRGVVEAPPSRVGDLRNGRTTEQKALKELNHLIQRVTSGAFAIRTQEAYLLSVVETWRTSRDHDKPIWRYDFDANALGPDIGGEGTVILEGVSSKFGDRARMTRIRRIIVDPYSDGEVNIRWAEPHPHEDGKPDGEIRYREKKVKGRVISDIPDIVADSGRPQADDQDVAVLSNHYNIYYVIEVTNPRRVLNDHGVWEENNQWFQGNVRANFLTSQWVEPVEAESEGLVLTREDNQGENLLKIEMNPEGKGPLPPDVHIQEMLTLINSARNVPEVIDGVGDSAFGRQSMRNVILAEFLGDKLEVFTTEAIQKQKSPDRFSQLTPEALRRDIAMTDRLDPKESVETFIQRAVDLRRRHSLTHLAVESQELIDLVQRLQALRPRPQRRGLKLDIDEEFGIAVGRLIEEKREVLDRFIRLFDVAHQKGIQVAFLLDWKALGEDPVDFFRLLSILLETYRVGFYKKVNLIAIDHVPSSGKDVQTVLEFFSDGQVPFVLLGDRSGLTRLGQLPVAQAHKVKNTASESILSELRIDHEMLPTSPPLEGMAFLTRQQVTVFDGTQADPQELAKTIKEAATTDWLDRVISGSLRYTSPVRRLVLDYLEIRKLAGLKTGLLSPVAQKYWPNSSRAFIAQVRLRKGDELHAGEIPLFPDQLNVTHLDLNGDFQRTHLDPGIYPFNVDLIPFIQRRRMPGEDEGVAFAVVDRVTTDHHVGGLNVSMGQVDDYWIVPVGGETFHFSRDEQEGSLVMMSQGQPGRVLVKPEGCWVVTINDSRVDLKIDRKGNLVILQKGQPPQIIAGKLEASQRRWVATINGVPLSLTRELEGELAVFSKGKPQPVSMEKSDRWTIVKGDETFHIKRDQSGYLTLWEDNQPSRTWTSDRHRTITVNSQTLHMKRDTEGNVTFWEEGHVPKQMTRPELPSKKVTDFIQLTSGLLVEISMDGRVGEVTLTARGHLIYADGRPLVMNTGTLVEDQVDEVPIAFSEADGHRVVAIDGENLHLKRDQGGNLRYWMEGQAEPETFNLSRPRMSDQVAKATVELSHRLPVSISLEGRYGLVTLEVGKHTIQLWELRDQIAYSHADDLSSVQLKQEVKPERKIPQARVENFAAKQVAQPSMTTREFVRNAVRILGTLWGIGALIRGVKRLHDAAQTREANARIRAAQSASGSNPRPAAGTVSPPRRLFNAFWTVGTTFLTGFLLWKAPALSAVPLASWAVAVAPYLSTVAGVVVGLFVLYRVGAAYLAMREAIQDRRANPESTLSHPALVFIATFFRQWMFPFMFVGILTLVFSGPQLITWPLFGIFGIFLGARVVHQGGIALSPVYYNRLVPEPVRVLLEWMSGGGDMIWRTTVVIAASIYVGGFLWAPLQAAGRYPLAEFITAAGSYLSLTQLGWAIVGLLAGWALWTGWTAVRKAQEAATAIRRPFSSAERARRFDDVVFRGLPLSVAVSATVGLLFGGAAAIATFLAWRGTVAILVAVDATTAASRKAAEQGNRLGIARGSWILLSTFVSTFLQGWAVHLAVVAGLIVAFYGWPALVALGSGVLVDPLANFLGGLTVWGTLRLFTTFLAAGMLAEVARPLLVTFIPGFLRLLPRLFGVEPQSLGKSRGWSWMTTLDRGLAWVSNQLSELSQSATGRVVVAFSGGFILSFLFWNPWFGGLPLVGYLLSGSGLLGTLATTVVTVGAAVFIAFFLWQRIVKPFFIQVALVTPLPTVRNWALDHIRPRLRDFLAERVSSEARVSLRRRSSDARVFFENSPEGRTVLSNANPNYHLSRSFTNLAELLAHGTERDLELTTQAFQTWLIQTYWLLAIREARGLSSRRRAVLERTVQRILNRGTQDHRVGRTRLMPDEIRVIEREVVRLQSIADANRFLEENPHARTHLGLATGQGIRDLAARTADPVAQRAALDLLNGFALQRQAVQFMVQLDFGARFGAHRFAWTRNQMMRRMRTDDTVGIFPAIYVFPDWNINYFTYGLGFIGIPFLFFSQFIQYSASMLMRWLRGKESGMNVIHSVLGYVSSEMEPRFFALINEVQGRWLVGHLFVLMNVFHGRFLHWDPDALVPSAYARTAGRLWDVIEMLLYRRDDLSRTAAFYAAFPEARNLFYAIGEQAHVSHFMRRNWNDWPRDGGAGGNDAESFGGSLFEPGEFGLRLIGSMNESLLYLPFSVEITEDGQIISSEVPGKWAVRYHRNLSGAEHLDPDRPNPTIAAQWNQIYYDKSGRRVERGPQGPHSELGIREGRDTTGPNSIRLDPTRQTPKSFRMGAALMVLQGMVRARPEMDAEGTITWVTTTPQQELAPEVEGARRAMEAQREEQRNQARQLYLEMADRLGSDGQIYPPGVAIPAGVVDLGPLQGLGHDPHREGHSRFMQWVYRAIDGLTFRRWGTVEIPHRGSDGRLYFSDQEMPAGVTDRGSVASPLSHLFYGMMKFLYGTSASFFAGVIILVGLVAGAWAFPFAFTLGIGLIAISRPILEGLVRRIVPIAFWGFRQTAIIAGIKAHYDPLEVLQLTRRATGQFQGRLPDSVALPTGVVNPQTRAGYVQLLRHGNQLLSSDDELLQAIVDLARALSGEQYRQNRSRPASSWERSLAGQICGRMQLFHPNWTPEERIAVWQVILRIIQGHRLAVGEEGVVNLHVGSDDPGVVNLGDRDFPFMLFRQFPGLMQNQVLATSLNAPYEYTRSWAWMNEATAVGGVRVTSIHRNPVQAYLNAIASGETGSSITDWYLEHTKLQPDANAITRVSARRSRDYIQEHRNQFGNISPEFETSGVFHTGENPMRMMRPDRILFRVSHWLDSAGSAFHGWVGRMVGTVGSLGLGGLLVWGAATGLVALSAPAWVASAAIGFIAVATFLSVVGSLFGPSDSLLVGGLVSFGVWTGLTAAGAPIPMVMLTIGVIALATLYTGAVSGNPMVGGMASLNRMIGFFGSLGMGGMLAWLAAIGLTAVGAPIWTIVAAVALIGLTTLVAVVSSLLNYRLDSWVDQGVRGDGVRALSLIPGILLKLPVWIFLMKSLHTVNRELPYSNDANLVARQLGQTPDMFMGLVHNLDWPMLFGWGFFPGMPVARLQWWTRSSTNWNATPIPYLTAVRLAHEPDWTRILSWFNYLPSAAIDLRLTLAEDTYLGEVLAFANGLAPVTPAVSIHRFNHLLQRFEEIRDDQDSLQRAMQFYKGMGMALAAQRMQESHPIRELVSRFRALSLDQQIQAFASLMPALKAYERPEVSMGGSTGVGVHSYLFTSLTSRRMNGRIPGVAGIYAPGEIEALFTYLMYERLDDLLGGAIARQIEQMNLDRRKLSGGHQIPPGQTLADQRVKGRLFEGTFTDPRSAFAAAKVAIYNRMLEIFETQREWGDSRSAEELLEESARRADEAMARVGTPALKAEAFQNSGYGRWLRYVLHEEIHPLSGISQARYIPHYKARTMRTMDLFNWSWGAEYELKSTDGYRHYRMVNNFLRERGKTEVLLLSDEALGRAKLVRKIPVGTRPTRPPSVQFPIQPVSSLAVAPPAGLEEYKEVVETEFRSLVTETSTTASPAPTISFAQQLAGLEELVTTSQMTPAEVGAVSRALHEKTLALSEVSVEEAIAAQSTRLRIQAGLEGQAKRVVEHMEKANGIGLTAGVTNSLVFIFEGENIAAALPVAGTGRRVGVITDYIATADGIKKLFQAAQLPEEQYKIVPLEAFGGDRDVALDALKKSFPVGTEFVPLPPNISLKEIEEIFRQYGASVNLTDAASGLEEVEEYLRSLA